MSKVVAEEYASSLSDLTVNSKPLINMLTMLAEENIDHAPAIVQAVEKHLQNVQSDIKLPVLYLIDSIVKNVGQAYIPLFTQNIVSSFCSVFEKVDERTRAQMFKLRQTWNEVFTAKKLYAVDVRVHSIDPAWPITAAMPTSIHVNPKFFKTQPPSPTISTPAIVPSMSLDLDALGSASVSDTVMRDELLRKQKELIELQQKKLELELMQTKAKLEEQQKQLDRQTGSVQAKHVQQLLQPALQAVGGNVFAVQKILEAAKLKDLSSLPSSTSIQSQHSSVAPPVTSVSASTKSHPLSRPTVRTRDPRLAARVHQNMAPTPLTSHQEKSESTFDSPKNKLECLDKNIVQNKEPKGFNKPKVRNSSKSSSPNTAVKSQDVVSKPKSSSPSSPIMKRIPKLKATGSKPIKIDLTLCDEPKIDTDSTSSKVKECNENNVTKKVSPVGKSLSPRKKKISSVEKDKLFSNEKEKTTTNNKSRSDSPRKKSKSSDIIIDQGKSPVKTKGRSRDHGKYVLDTFAQFVRSDGDSPSPPPPPVISDSKKQEDRAKFKDVKMSAKRRNYVRRNRDESRSRSRSPIRSDVDLRLSGPLDKHQKLLPSVNLNQKPPVDAVVTVTTEAAKDVDLRQLPGTGSRSSPSRKRTSAEREAPDQPPTKKSKAEIFDVLFGNEDVDLRQLPPVPVAQLSKAPSPPPPPIISRSSVPKKNATSTSKEATTVSTKEDGKKSVVKGKSSDGHIKGNGEVNPRDWAKFKGPNTPSPYRSRTWHKTPQTKLDRFGRTLVLNKTDDGIGKRRSLPFNSTGTSSEDTDMRSYLNKEDSLDDVDVNINIIVAQAEEHFKSGQINFMQYNTLLKQVIHLNEKNKLREAQRRDENSEQQSWEKNNQSRGMDLSPVSEDDSIGDQSAAFSPQSDNSDTNRRSGGSSDGRFGDIDERFLASSTSRGGRPRRGMTSRHERPTRSHGPLRSDMPSRTDVSTRPGLPSRPELSTRSDNSMRSEMPTRPDLLNRSDMSFRPDGRPDIPGRSDMLVRPDLVGRPDIPGRPDMLGRPDRLDMPGATDMAGRPNIINNRGRGPGHLLNRPSGIGANLITGQPGPGGPNNWSWERPPTWHHGPPAIRPMHPQPFMHPPGADIRWRPPPLQSQPPPAFANRPPGPPTFEPRFERFGPRPERFERRMGPILQAPPVDRQELPPADPLTLEHIANDSMRTINIDGIPREIRFYGDTAVVLLAWDDPREIGFQGDSRRVMVDDVDQFICLLNNGYRDCLIDGELHQIKLGAPTRELYIDGKWYECFFGGPPINIEIGGKMRSIKLDGPPPQAKIGTIKRMDLCAGKINLIIDAMNMVSVFLDAKPQRFDIENKPHILRFINALTKVLINGRPFDVEFGGLPKPIYVSGKKHFIRFSVLPQQVKPGYITIRNMEGGRLPSPPPREEGENSRGAEEKGNVQTQQRRQHSMPNFGGPTVIRYVDDESAIDSDQRSGSPYLIDDEYDEEVMPVTGVYIKRKPGALEMLTSLMPSVMAPSSGFGYQVQHESTSQDGLSSSKPKETLMPDVSEPPPSVPSALPSFLPPNINVDELFEKLVASGIVPNQVNTSELGTPLIVAEEKKREDTNIVKLVDLGDVESLKVEQPGMVGLLYAGIQCNSCGVRFLPELTTRYSQHLDWHFRQNRRERDNNKTGISRKWYYDIPDWSQFEEIEDLEQRAQSWFEAEQLAMEATEDVEPPKQPSVPVGVNSENPYCEMCHDKFDHFYNEENEEWHFRKAVRVDDKVYHPTCYEDYKNSMCSFSSVDEPSGNDDVKEEFKGETSIEDMEIIELKVEVEEIKDAILIEEAIEIREENDQPLDVKAKDIDDLLPFNACLAIDGVDEENMGNSEAVQVASAIMDDIFSSAALQLGLGEIKLELLSIDDVAYEVKQDEKIEEVTLEEPKSIAPVTDTTHTEVVSSIDGNVQFEDKPQGIVSATAGKIKINITKAIASREHPIEPETLPKVPDIDECAPLVPRTVIEEDDEPPPPGVDPMPVQLPPAVMKPRLIGRTLTELPPVMKGTELSGLCSIM